MIIRDLHVRAKTQGTLIYFSFVSEQIRPDYLVRSAYPANERLVFLDIANR